MILQQQRIAAGLAPRLHGVPLLTTRCRPHTRRTLKPHASSSSYASPDPFDDAKLLPTPSMPWRRWWSLVPDKQPQQSEELPATQQILSTMRRLWSLMVPDIGWVWVGVFFMVRQVEGGGCIEGTWTCMTSITHVLYHTHTTYHRLQQHWQSWQYPSACRLHCFPSPNQAHHHSLHTASSAWG